MRKINKRGRGWPIFKKKLSKYYLIELSTGLWNPTAVGQCNIAHLFTGTQEGVPSDQGPWVRPCQPGTISR